MISHSASEGGTNHTKTYERSGKSLSDRDDNSYAMCDLVLRHMVAGGTNERVLLLHILPRYPPHAEEPGHLVT